MVVSDEVQKQPYKQLETSHQVPTKTTNYGSKPVESKTNLMS